MLLKAMAHGGNPQDRLASLPARGMADRGMRSTQTPSNAGAFRRSEGTSADEASARRCNVDLSAQAIAKCS